MRIHVFAGEAGLERHTLEVWEPAKKKLRTTPGLARVSWGQVNVVRVAWGLSITALSMTSRYCFLILE